jgi:hypothetical protein
VIFKAKAFKEVAFLKPYTIAGEGWDLLTTWVSSSSMNDKKVS